MSSTDALLEQEITLKIIYAVSDRLDTPAEELPPLSDTIEPDALNRIFASDPESLELTFSYVGLKVAVDETRAVTLSEHPT